MMIVLFQRFGMQLFFVPSLGMRPTKPLSAEMMLRWETQLFSSTRQISKGTVVDYWIAWRMGPPLHLVYSLR